EEPHMRGVTRPPARLLTATLASLVTVAWGCGGSGKPPVSSSTTEAKVSGRVLIKGKPATKGTVHFDPSNYRRKMEPVRSAPINPDGSYEITTLVGENTVSVRGRGLGYADQTLSVIVAKGQNTFDIVLPAEGAQ